MVFRRMPSRNIVNIKNEIDKVYDEIFNRSENETDSISDVFPLVNVTENDQVFMVSAELPGMETADVKITFNEGTLCLSGEKKRMNDQVGNHTHRSEREFGSFSRNFSIPNKIQADKIEASFDKGVLNILLPKAEESRPQEIKINVK